jgi:hypothetical protein
MIKQQLRLAGHIIVSGYLGATCQQQTGKGLICLQANWCSG